MAMSRNMGSGSLCGLDAMEDGCAVKWCTDQVVGRGLAEGT